MFSDSIPTKVCSQCGERKRFDEFNKSMTSRDGLKPYCKACAKAYYNQNSDRILQQKAEKRNQHPDGVKRCSRCQIEKPYGSFNKDKSRNDGYRHYCKACGKNYRDGRDVSPARREGKGKPVILRAAKIKAQLVRLEEIKARVEARRVAVARLVKVAGYVIDNAEPDEFEMAVSIEDFNDLRLALAEVEKYL